MLTVSSIPALTLTNTNAAVMRTAAFPLGDSHPLVQPDGHEE